MDLSPLVSSLDQLLSLETIKDYPNALNGLQVENSGRVDRVAVAVDACESVIRAAVDGGAHLLIVHHGLFWSGLRPVTDAAYRKLKLALDHDLAIYSAHLPLDAHPVLGNNALLCDAIGLPSERSAFLDIGFQAEMDIPRDALAKRLQGAVNGPIHLAPGGPSQCHRIGVVTGGAGSEIFKTSGEVDTFITGEGPHWSYTAAEECGVNLFYAGHYATETFGVKALGGHLESQFSLPWEFIDHPTGL